MKFHELKHEFLNKYVELEYFENCVLILNLFVIDNNNRFDSLVKETMTLWL